MSANREIELKATIRPEQLDKVKDLAAIRKRAVGRARSRKLVTVYYDTPDYDLRQQGLSLRVRKIGRAYVQCVKQTHKRLGGIPVRMEWEGPVPSQDPAVSVIEDKKLRRLIRRAGTARLQPVFRTDFQRNSRSLKFEDGSTASLDLDIGEIIAGDVSEPICEFELELHVPIRFTPTATKCSAFIIAPSPPCADTPTPPAR
jgi:inorganic triphosphatase YgiF